MIGRRILLLLVAVLGCHQSLRAAQCDLLIRKHFGYLHPIQKTQNQIKYPWLKRLSQHSSTPVSIDGIHLVTRLRTQCQHSCAFNAVATYADHLANTHPQAATREPLHISASYLRAQSILIRTKQVLQDPGQFPAGMVVGSGLPHVLDVIREVGVLPTTLYRERSQIYTAELIAEINGALKAYQQWRKQTQKEHDFDGRDRRYRDEILTQVTALVELNYGRFPVEADFIPFQEKSALAFRKRYIEGLDMIDGDRLKSEVAIWGIHYHLSKKKPVIISYKHVAELYDHASESYLSPKAEREYGPSPGHLAVVDGIVRDAEQQILGFRIRNAWGSKEAFIPKDYVGRFGRYWMLLKLGDSAK